MEMAEEGIIINRPQITPKRIKVEEIVEEEEDRISALPDGLLVEILSRLPDTEDAIRTGTLSKRWKYLWTSVPTLIFIQLYSDKRPSSDFVSFVDKTLTQCRPSKLRKFVVHIFRCGIQFESQVNNWIRFAVSCNVEELELGIVSPELLLLNEYFFINSCFTDLRLECCISINPTGAISWKRLRSLNIFYVKLDEDLIEKILSGSPLLETMMLDYCSGFRRLDITSKSVKKLVFSRCVNLVDGPDIEINAPNLLSFTAQAGVFFWKLLLLNVSSLFEA